MPSKVAHAAAAISLGLEGELWLGDLEARRDWGYAGDYVRAMWLMVQQPEPATSTSIATGVTHSVRELVEARSSTSGSTGSEYVHIDESLVRGKAELHNLVGDPAKARARLGWEPTVTFEGLVQLLVDAELERLRGAGSAGELAVDRVVAPRARRPT